MRIVRACLLCLVAVPVAQAGTPKPKPHCKDSCKSTYNLCMKRSNTKMTKKGCKAQNKTCKKRMPGVGSRVSVLTFVSGWRELQCHASHADRSLWSRLVIGDEGNQLRMEPRPSGSVTRTAY